MCLIIANIDGREVPEAFIRSAFVSNDDGFGVMYANEEGKLQIIRGLFGIDKILEIFKQLEAGEIPYVAHFRMRTHGEISESNCHPFPLVNQLGGVGMAHNGCFSGEDFYYHPNKSDTALMADKLVDDIEAGRISTRDFFSENMPTFKKLYSDNLSWSRVVFMNGDGDINIHNEEDGAWINGVWYSNPWAVGRKDAIIKTYNYTYIENVNVIRDVERLSLILEGYDEDGIQEIDAEIIDDDDDSIDEAKFDAFSGNDLTDFVDTDDDEDTFVMHPHSASNGYKDKKYNAKKFMFEGVEYDLTENAPFLTKEDIEELIESADAGEAVAKSMIEDLVERSQNEAERKTILPAKASNDDDDDDDSGYWNQFVSEYNKTRSAGSLMLPATVEEEKKSYTTTTRGYGSYGSYGSYGGYSYTKDKYDEIVELMLRP